VINARFPLSALLILLLVLSVEARDNKPPRLTITSPTTASSYVTTSASVTVRGQQGIVTGTTAWQLSLTLLAGVTKLTVTAVDTAGHTGQDVLTITLMASPPPPGPITVIWAWSGGGETFQVERCTVPCGAMAAVAAVAITDRQWTDTGVQPTSNYCYRLAVVTGGSRGPYSNTLCSQ
jgi:hypothetical protein